MRYLCDKFIDINNVIDEEGIIKICNELKLDVMDPVILALAWNCNAQISVNFININ